MSTPRSSLSLEIGDASSSSTERLNNNTTNDYDVDRQLPLDERIITIIEGIPDRTIRPGRLAAELGISVEDASAELCGLLAAVGGGSDGATFHFEKSGSSNVMTMVFIFPENFRKRALAKRRRDERWQSAVALFQFAVKFLKIITAFGLILSLVIVSVVVMAGLIAAFIAVARGGDRRQQNAVINQIHHIFFTIRQLLWCYALFGPVGTGEDDDGRPGQDPFLREVAYDLWLLSSVCCGNPGSIFFWMRASQLNHRRRYAFRGWSLRSNQQQPSNEIIPGVTIVSRGDSDWNTNSNTSNALLNQSTEYRGLLSVAVEFLFGPTPFEAGPSPETIWKLRAAAILQIASKNSNSGVTLRELAPYIDNPPESINDTATIASQALLLVSFFNGVPQSVTGNDSSPGTALNNNDPSTAAFFFPELMAESTVATRYNYQPADDDGLFTSLLYNNATVSSTSRRNNTTSSNTLPSYLYEERYKFSSLSKQQFCHCIILGTLNMLGVYWTYRSICLGGVLDLTATPLDVPIRKGLYPVLKFYALLYFALPLGRLVLVLMLNYTRQERNERRAQLVQRTLQA